MWEETARWWEMSVKFQKWEADTQGGNGFSRSEKAKARAWNG